MSLDAGVLILVTVIGAATPLLLAALGELVVEKSGVLNLGIEGMMLAGAVTAFATAITTGSSGLGIVTGALAVAVGGWVLMARSIIGFEVKVVGQAPAAARFAGFARSRIIWFCLLLSGGLAGVAGLFEVAGPVGQLVPVISPGYGFTAIIVAFLGRLHPIGVVFGGLILALSYLGGEAAQIDLGMPNAVTGIFQGILLFFLLACDVLILYRLRAPKPAAGGA